MKKLQIILSKQEKVERITANLNNLKSDGEVSEEEVVAGFRTVY
ncbi:MAG: hypothetical protein U9N55_00420 [candidate division Zixibacteria bacterium]|nr:hypothetical protein [candidate division Zixibacteria bacterium]